MKTTRDVQEGASGVCANEGCGRAAEKGLCERCALEWSLFHRETRIPNRTVFSPREEGAPPARGRP